ncbi:MAG: DUF58 domain-containing protein [Planctomycetota bacterium]
MPAWDEPAVTVAARRLRLAADPRRRRMGEGVRLGNGPGASLEFHDHRAYAPGDDLRHLDWSAFARSEQLVIRRHRKEVSPRVEILFDVSQSMAVTPEKLALATALAALFATLAERDGGRPRLWSLGAKSEPMSTPWRPVMRRLVPTGASGPAVRPGPQLAAGGERLLISDGLCPESPADIVRRLGSEAGSIGLVQLLTRDELAPTAAGPVRLEDVEGGAADLLLDEQAVTTYRQRLARLQSAWQQTLNGRGFGVCTVAVEDGFDAAVRRLTRSGVVIPTGGG